MYLSLKSEIPPPDIGFCEKFNFWVLFVTAIGTLETWENGGQNDDSLFQSLALANWPYRGTPSLYNARLTLDPLTRVEAKVHPLQAPTRDTY